MNEEKQTTATPKRKLGKRPSDSQRRMLARKYKQGLRIGADGKQLAKQLGYCQASLIKWATKFGVTGNTRRRKLREDKNPMQYKPLVLQKPLRPQADQTILMIGPTKSILEGLRKFLKEK